MQTAAQTYFGHGASKLTLPEAALLAGIPEDPSRWDPAVNPKAARLRREIVLRAMLGQDHITAADFKKANAAPLPKREDIHLPARRTGRAPYFTNYVKQLLVDKYGTGRVFATGSACGRRSTCSCNRMRATRSPNG